MSATRVAYRAVAYARRSEDITEATELVPAAGAPHSDDFKIATVSGLSGYQPYMGLPTGARGGIDPLSRAWKTGQLTIPILDKRTAETSELSRWVTAYLGDSKGRNQMLGCRMFVEISTDWDDVALSGTWSPFWVGRIDETHLDNPLFYSLVLDDFAKDLDVDCFADRPHSGVSYAAEPQLLPIGLAATYGDFTAANTMTGTIGAVTVTRGSVERLITLSNASQALADNLVTWVLFQHLYALAGQSNDSLGGVLSQGAGLGLTLTRPHVRLRCSCASPSFSNKEVEVVTVRVFQRTDRFFGLSAIVIRPLMQDDGITLATDDPAYQAFDTGTVADAASLTGISLRLDARRSSSESGAFSEDAPLFLGDVHVLDLFRDICDGDFSALYRSGLTIPTGKAAGDQVYPISLDTAGSGPWDVLRNPATTLNSYPTIRAKITKRMKRFAVLEQLGQQFGFAYRLQPAASAVARIVPVDMRLPTSASLGAIDTLTEADVSAETPVTWESARGSAITEFEIKGYVDYQIRMDQIEEAGGVIRWPVLSASRIESAEVATIIPDYGRAIDLGQKVHVVDGWAMRGTVGATDTVENVHALTYQQALAEQCASHYRTLFGNGATYVSWKSHRTAYTTDLWPGDWVYLDLNVLPDQGTNLRGGARLVQVLERSEDGLLIGFKAIDAGAGSAANAPTIGSPSQRTSDTYHGISAAITLNAQSEFVEFQAAVQATSYGTTAPGHNDPSWFFVQLVKASATVHARNLPSNARIFVRVRSVPSPNGTNGTPKLPSAWATPSGTKYVDTAALTAPSAVATLPATILTTSTVTATCTNADTAHAVEVILTTGGNDTLVKVLVPGSIGPVTLNAYLASSTTYTVSFRLRDELGGTSAKGTSASFVTPAAFVGPTLTAPTLTLVIG